MARLQLDKRLNAYRDDLADENLRGKVDAERYVAPRRMRVALHFADLLRSPDPNAGLDTQVLHGHEVDVFDQTDGWAWVQRVDDGYVGYLREETLGEAGDGSTHMVLAPRTFLYSSADLKHPRTGYRSMGSKLIVTDQVSNRGTDYALLENGDAVIARHLIEIGDWQSDPVSVAATLLHTPYLWGGDTGFGIDCSGLVFLSHMLCGNTVLRDSDMQESSIGEQIDNDFENLQRGDLVFWRGHVGMMVDGKNLLHANGHTMNVALEPLDAAIERIGYLYSEPTSVRRP